MNTRIIMMDYAGGHVPTAGLRGRATYGRADLRGLMSLCRDVGFDTVWFRTSFCGTVCYHSKVMKPFDGEYRLYVNGPLKRAMAEFDPLEVAVREAHRCGLSVLAWITPMDNYYPGIEDPVLARHPEWLLRSRDGRHAMRGVPCFACNEYVDRRVDEVQEVMDYGCDGVYHAWGTHTVDAHAEADPEDEPDSFGWNRPILEEYQRRHGNPGELDAYDQRLVSEIHADFMDDFVRRSADAVHERGGEYVTSNTSGVLTTDEYSWYTYRPGGAKVFRLPAHWRKWVQEKWVDRLAAGADGKWLAENESIAPVGVPLVGQMHAAWAGDAQHPELCEQTGRDLAERVRRCVEGPLDGVAIQESDTIEGNDPALWELLKRVFADCAQGKEPAAR